MKRRDIILLLPLCLLFPSLAFALTFHNDWSVGYQANDKVQYSIDSLVTYNGLASLKIENKNYNTVSVTRTFEVLPDRQYRLSAMVKYADYRQSPTDKKESGANLGKLLTMDHSRFIRDGEWTKVEYLIDTGKDRTVDLSINNGMFYAACRGTAWFTDVKLEKNNALKSNKWNVLAVIFKNVDAPVTIDGKRTRCRESLDDVDVELLTAILKKLPSTFTLLSDGQMNIRQLDVVACDETLTYLEPSGDYLYTLNPYHEEISKILDGYLKKGFYNQIIAIAPIRDVVKGWWGLGGGTYYDAEFCQIQYITRGTYPTLEDSFPDAVFVHEILHGLERRSNEIAPEKTAVLHDAEKYGYSDDGHLWYSDYMCSRLPDGKGVDPSVFKVYSDPNFETVYTERFENWLEKDDDDNDDDDDDNNKPVKPINPAPPTPPNPPTPSEPEGGGCRSSRSTASLVCLAYLLVLKTRKKHL